MSRTGLVLVRAGPAAVVVLASGCGFMSTIGAAAVRVAGAGGVAAGGVLARGTAVVRDEAAASVAVCVTARVSTGARRVVVRLVRVTVRVLVAMGLPVGGAAGELVLVAAGSVLVLSAVGAVVTGGASGVETAGAGSSGSGCTCCAISGVEESARAAAIGGRALARIWEVLFVIIRTNRHAAVPVAQFTLARQLMQTNRRLRA